LRSLGSLSAEQAAVSFERLRTEAILRPEFNHFIIDLPERHRNLAEVFTDLGFKSAVKGNPL
jgi:hypothetical protein